MLGAGQFLQADGDSHEQLFEKLNAVQSLQADFFQHIRSENEDQEANQEGRIAFQRPGKFLWVVSKPFEQEVLIEGDRMSVYDADLEQLTHSKIDDSNELSLANLLISPNKEILDQFEISHKDTKFSLVPQDPNVPFKELVIQFDDEKVSDVSVKDHFNTVSEFKFANIRINQDIDSKIFTIEVPPDTEVVTYGESENPAQNGN